MGHRVGGGGLDFRFNGAEGLCEVCELPGSIGSNHLPEKTRYFGILVPNGRDQAAVPLNRGAYLFGALGLG